MIDGKRFILTISTFMMILLNLPLENGSITESDSA